MKKILALLLVLGMASVVNATVIDVVVTHVNGSAPGTGWDPATDAAANDEIRFVLHLNDNDSMHPSYATYDGYWLKGMDLMLTVTGKGTLAERGTGPKRMKNNALFGAWADPTTVGDPMVTDNKIYKLSGASQANSESGIGSHSLMRGATEIVWTLMVTLDGDFNPASDVVLVDLALNDDPLAGSSFYTDQPSAGPTLFPDYVSNGYGTWDGLDNQFMTNSSFGDLELGVPEPMTIALLGLGGLGLISRRRRRRA
jgi:hypothetical protein